MADPVDSPIGLVTASHFRPRRVRHQVFLGPKVIYSLFNPRDRMHVVSRAFMDFVRDDDLPFRRLLVNEHIVDEAATRLKRRAGMPNARRFVETLEESSVFRLERVPDATFDSASDRFVEWADQDASMTDFVVATHMETVDVDHIVTYDRHYDAFDLTTLPYTE